ncbi:hypothetical protein H7J06_11600 [Mycobacterium hodleri]|uniref:hypothetical protein n=1 Tax=Mycolicibacterium hodleri TaxID=49897 RepID=UPI0021F32653|nr:hypothetical protein [Mycolicibacterium hodleri]MCV7133631.1 hypothetical protein [Mycolicibacterium hodleri]
MYGDIGEHVCERCEVSEVDADPADLFTAWADKIANLTDGVDITHTQQGIVLSIADANELIEVLRIAAEVIDHTPR